MTEAELHAKWAEFQSETGNDFRCGSSVTRVLDKEDGTFQVRFGRWNTQPEADLARVQFGEALAEKFGSEVEFVFTTYWALDLL